MIDDSSYNYVKGSDASQLRARNVPGKDPIVLIVVEDAVRAFTLSTILTKSGFANISACDSVAALEGAALIQPRLLIADASLPGMTGIQLAVVMKQTIAECDAILVEGLASLDEVRATVRMLGHDFPILCKPVQPVDLLSCVRDCLANPRPMRSCWEENAHGFTKNSNLPNARSGRFVV